ncbi:MAG TPA: SMC-Scp complex subunit ScpB [Candidatus Paceibacterota bacterium]|nr:SMC-Scp complex subunit ScpB [Candidatus Paceibacterota bacterium]
MTNQKDYAGLAEAFLFAEGGTISLKRLQSLLGCTKDELAQALNTLSLRLEESALILIRTETEATLAVAPHESEALRARYEQELGREIGDAGLEVIAIVLYRGPSTRSEIDYIRGVNTSSTIRNLLARSLIERVENPNDGRTHLYRPSTELLAYLGISDIEKLPEYATIASELKAFEEHSGPFTEQYERDRSDTTGRTLDVEP